MKTLLLSAVLILPAAAFAETVWCGTGPNGGTANGTVACMVENAQLICDRTAQGTSPVGRTFTRQGQSVHTADGVTSQFSTTTGAGRTFSTDRVRTRR